MEISEKEFSLLYKQYSGRIYNYIYRSIASEEDAHDILQDVFVILHSKKASLEFKDNKIVYWLFRVARNLILAFIKKNKNRYQKEFLIPESWEIPSKQSSVEKRLELQETEDRLYNFLMDLGERERTIFVLHRIEKYKYKEIKEMLNLSERTLKRIIRNVLDKIATLNLLD